MNISPQALEVLSRAVARPSGSASFNRGDHAELDGLLEVALELESLGLLDAVKQHTSSRDGRLDHFTIQISDEGRARVDGGSNA
jgi:hypothetical protein